MASGITVSTNAFRDGIEVAVRQITDSIESDLQRIGLGVQNDARRACPVDTGRLRSSIVSVPGRDAVGPFVVIGTNVDYAPYVEYGTRHMGAQPFLRPAVRAAARRFG